MLEIIEGRFPAHVEVRWLESARALRDGHAALARADFAAAHATFAFALGRRVQGTRDASILALLQEWARSGASIEPGKRAELESKLRNLAASR